MAVLEYDYDHLLEDEGVDEYERGYHHCRQTLQPQIDRLEIEVKALRQQIAAWERTSSPDKELEVEKYINEFILQRAQASSSREATPPTQQSQPFV